VFHVKGGLRFSSISNGVLMGPAQLQEYNCHEFSRSREIPKWSRGVLFQTRRLNDFHISETVTIPVLMIPASLRIALLS
jgi:hypothetical protein